MPSHALILATFATAFHLHGTMADGTPTPSFAHAHPRVLAASADDLDAGRVHLGDRVCVRFPEGERIGYVVKDRCPACGAGTVDLLVASTSRAIEFGRQPVTVTAGICGHVP